jgi:choline kinase
MRVIIPAAGVGTRLQPITNQLPKCMVDIRGKPLIYYLLRPLRRLTVSEVVIVVGHKKELIQQYVESEHGFPPVKFVDNNQYDRTNSIVSIALTRELWDEPFCIIDSDLLVRPKLIELLFAYEDSFLIIDATKPYEQIDMKVRIEDGRFITMDKTLPKDAAQGEFFGLSRWMPGESRVFAQVIDEFIKRGETGVWYEWAIREVANRIDLRVHTCGPDLWYEIDNERDYGIAQDLMQKWAADWS